MGDCYSCYLCISMQRVSKYPPRWYDMIFCSPCKCHVANRQVPFEKDVCYINNINFMNYKKVRRVLSLKIVHWFVIFIYRSKHTSNFCIKGHQIEGLKHDKWIWNWFRSLFLYVHISNKKQSHVFMMEDSIVSIRNGNQKNNIYKFYRINSLIFEVTMQFWCFNEYRR